MHTLTLTPFYPTAVDDASGCFIAESVGELQRQGIESSVIAVHPMHHSRPSPDPNALPATWRKYFCLPGDPGASSPGQFLHVALKFQARRLHARPPISLIHAHAALPCGQVALLLARDLGIPFVVTVHGLDAFSTQQVPRWFGRRCSAVCDDVCGAAARVICISEQVARRVREGLGGPVRISVVYNGVNTSLFSQTFGPTFSPANDLACENVLILSVGNLPIWYEGLGCVYLEAMTTERPTMTCRGQGIEEVIRHGENGWLIQPKNLDDLMTALRVLLSDRPLRERLGRNGRQTVLQGYTLAHQARQLLTIYRECLV
jgi:glycosyltransferase involved in cell wall biosynthesis